MKEWTLETLISQLKAKTIAAGLGDPLDVKSEAYDMTVGDLIDVLKDHAFNNRMRQIEGQSKIMVDALGNVSVTEVHTEDVKVAKAKRTGEDE